MVKAIIALGSNLGNSRKILQDSLQIIAQSPDMILEYVSNYYETIPIGPSKPNYFNACALLTVNLTLQELLARLSVIEQKFGRVRTQRWGARTLDLDLIFYDDLILQTPTLEVPHPRMRERAFVLVPLVEIAPHWLDPLSKKTSKELLQGLDCSGVKKIL